MRKKWLSESRNYKILQLTGRDSKVSNLIEGMLGLLGSISERIGLERRK